MMISIPNVGSEVRVTTKYPNSYLFSSEEFVYHTHEGVVLKSESWVQPNSFTMTGDQIISIRTISLDNVDKLEYISGSGSAVSTKTGISVFKVKSKETGKTYRVTNNNGKVECACIGFQYRKYCKHSKAIIAFCKK